VVALVGLLEETIQALQAHPPRREQVQAACIERLLARILGCHGGGRTHRESGTVAFDHVPDVA